MYKRQTPRRRRPGHEDHARVRPRRVLPEGVHHLPRRRRGLADRRRGALAETTTEPVRRFRVDPAGTVQAITLADEPIEIPGYGTARQLTLFEHDQPVMQILTSDTTAPAAALLAWLRCRWRIENVFKYLTVHHGIDWLCDYRADLGPCLLYTSPSPRDRS